MPHSRSNPLIRAVRLWWQDMEIPMDLYAELATLGHDVPRLEARYRRNVLSS